MLRYVLVSIRAVPQCVVSACIAMACAVLAPLVVKAESAAGAGPTSETVEIEGFKHRVIQERNAAGTAVKQVIAGPRLNEITLDTDGDGSTDFWEIKSGKTTLRTYAPYKGHFSRMDIEQRQAKGTIELRYYLSADKKEYVLVGQSFMPYKQLRQQVQDIRFGDACSLADKNLYQIQKNWRDLLDKISKDDIDKRKQALIAWLRNPNSNLFGDDCRKEPFKDSLNAMTEGIADVMVSTTATSGSERPTFLRCLETNGLATHAARIERNFWLMLLNPTARIGAGSRNSSADLPEFGVGDLAPDTSLATWRPMSCSKVKDPDWHGTWDPQKMQIRFHRPASDLQPPKFKSPAQQYAKTFFHESMHASSIMNEELAHTVENCCGDGLPDDHQSCKNMRTLLSREHLTQSYESVLAEMYPDYLKIKTEIWDSFGTTEGDVLIGGYFQSLHASGATTAQFRKCTQGGRKRDECLFEMATTLKKVTETYFNENCETSKKSAWHKELVDCEKFTKKMVALYDFAPLTTGDGPRRCLPPMKSGRIVVPGAKWAIVAAWLAAAEPARAAEECTMSSAPLEGLAEAGEIAASKPVTPPVDPLVTARADALSALQERTADAGEFMKPVGLSRYHGSAGNNSGGLSSGTSGDQTSVVQKPADTARSESFNSGMSPSLFPDRSNATGEGATVGSSTTIPVTAPPPSTSSNPLASSGTPIRPIELGQPAQLRPSLGVRKQQSSRFVEAAERAIRGVLPPAFASGERQADGNSAGNGTGTNRAESSGSRAAISDRAFSGSSSGRRRGGLSGETVGSKRGMRGGSSSSFSFGYSAPPGVQVRLPAPAATIPNLLSASEERPAVPSLIPEKDGGDASTSAAPSRAKGRTPAQAGASGEQGEFGRGGGTAKKGGNAVAAAAAPTEGPASSSSSAANRKGRGVSAERSDAKPDYTETQVIEILTGHYTRALSHLNKTSFELSLSSYRIQVRDRYDKKFGHESNGRIEVEPPKRIFRFCEKPPRFRESCE